jgi:hypothetical protein
MLDAVFLKIMSDVLGSTGLSTRSLSPLRVVTDRSGRESHHRTPTGRRWHAG